MERFEDLFEDLRAECEKILDLYQPSFHSFHEAYGVIKEELDEFWDCVKENKPEGMKEGLIQIAAASICAAWMYELGEDNPNFKWPPK